MFSKTRFRPNNRTHILSSMYVLLCAGLLTVNSSLAATNEPVKQSTPPLTTSEPVKTTDITDKPEKPVYPQTLAGAKQAFKDKNFLDALKILLMLEDDYAGQVEYDYLLGRSALETKNFDAAIAAFTRVLTVDPDFAAGRFELARTYYSKGVSYLARGPFEQARMEFDLVNKMNPPPELKQAIAQYQDNIDKYLKARETQFRMFVEMSAGYDSNIGTAPEDDYFTYYDYGTATSHTYDLRADSQQEESFFGQMQAGIGIDWPLFSNDFEIFGRFMAGGRSYSNNHDYDHIWNEVQFGARHYGKNDKKTFRARFKRTDVRDDKDSTGWQRYHDQGEVMLNWAIKATDNTALSFWILGGDSNYQAHGTYVYSVNYNRQGAEATILSDGKRKSSFQILLLDGRDNPQECKDGPYCPDFYTRDVEGMRLGWGVNIFDSSRFYSSLYLERSTYDRQFFFQERRDKRGEIFMAINTAVSESWYFRPEIHYTHNHSTVELFDHERWFINMTFGWEI